MEGDHDGGGLVVALLGPVEIGPAGGMTKAVSQPRVRVLLGLLGVAAGRVVSAEALVDGLWGEEWSPGRELNLHGQVSALRRRLEQAEPGLGGARLARVGPGYRLELGPAELDVEAFRELAGRGREAARAGETLRARELYGQALGCWRGPALADAAPLCPRLAGEAARLEEARLALVEERIACDLALGRHGEVAGELAGLVAEFPLREGLAGLLMTALYRCGRRGEALAVFDAARRVLAGELGLDPGPELVRLQAQVLADDPALAAPAPPTGTAPGAAGAGVVPRQLPPGAGFFAGREAELKQLDALLDRAEPADIEACAGEPGRTVVISAVAGMAGVGKTALAVHWARRVAGRFPDGQLYVNLRGYDQEGAPVTPEEATGWFLAGLGVPAAQIPADAQAQFGLYRSVLAGRRVLIVLDNARDAAQVRPLLPGSPGCLVIVTSRASLAGLAAAEGAHPLRLLPLSADDAIQLLAARLGAERVAAEPEAVTGLITRCGHLPLALGVMAARAAADPGLPLAALAAELARASGADTEAAGLQAGGGGLGRLEVLETGDPATSLRELLSWSHRQLSPPAARMFVLLGAHCGPDITVPAAASLVGVPRPDARRAVAELVRASLVTEQRAGRYVMHDLVRGYAAELARPALGETAIREAIARTLDHYLHTMLPSYERPVPFTVAPPGPGVVPEQLAGEAGLAEWAQAEHQVLLQTTFQAAAAGFVTRAWQLLACQGWFVSEQGYWADFQAAGQAVVSAAEAAGDQAALGWSHAFIGWFGTFTGEQDDSRGRLHQALDHFRQAGDLRGRAWAHLFAARPAAHNGDWAEAAALMEQGRVLCRQASDRYGEKSALVGLGEYHVHLGNYDLACGYARQALAMAPAAGDPSNPALAWKVLGLVYSRLGDYRQAIDCYRQALGLTDQWKTSVARGWLASLLADFGDACQAAGDLPAAREAWQQSLQIRDGLGLPDTRRIRGRLEQASPSRKAKR